MSNLKNKIEAKSVHMNDIITNFLSSDESTINKKLKDTNKINLTNTYKVELKKHILNDMDSLQDDVTSSELEKLIIDSAVKHLSKFSDDTIKKYISKIKPIAIEYASRMLISSDPSYEKYVANISSHALDLLPEFLSKLSDSGKKLPKDSDFKNFVIDAAKEVTPVSPQNVEKKKEDSKQNKQDNQETVVEQDNQETKPEETKTEENKPEEKVENLPVKNLEIQFVENDDTKKAIDELKKVMKDVDGFDIKNIKTNQTARLIIRLRKVANKKILAVQDMFKFLQDKGFDSNIAQSGMIATYYEGNDLSTLNGLADTIFYYVAPVVANRKSRLKRLADDQLLLEAPEQEQQMLLPENAESLMAKTGFYIVTEGPHITGKDNFEEAEKWLLNDRKDIISREVINNSYISGETWNNYERDLYEKLSKDRYKDGPVNDANYKAIEISIPDDLNSLNLYNIWLEKYKDLFKSYNF